MLISIWPRAAAPCDPWFRRHPRVAVAVAGALYVAILLLRLLVGGPVDAFSMLYALPVALVAITFGLRSGVAAGLIAVALTVLWAVVQDVSLSPMAWASRVIPMLVLGPLLGDASDQLRRSETERRRLEAAALLEREAIEINDSLVQGMAAAKWALEASRPDAGLQILNATITQAEDLVSSLIRRADHGLQTSPSAVSASEQTTSP